MNQRRSGEANISIFELCCGRLRALFRVGHLGIAQRDTQIIVPMAVHERGLLRIYFNRISANENVVEHVMVMGFRAYVDWLLLLRKRAEPQEQYGGSEKFRHGGAIVAGLAKEARAKNLTNTQATVFHQNRMRPAAMIAPMEAPIQKFCHHEFAVCMTRRSFETSRMKMRIGTVSTPAITCDQ